MVRPSEYDMGLAERRATYKRYAQAIPGAFAIEKLDKAPCRMACPAGVNVQGYVQMVKEGKYREAVEIIMRDLPFPGVLGRICTHRCERSCRRLEVDEAISIMELKRVAADHVDLREIPVPEITPRDEKVAIIGSGPAGLTAAYFLALDGYKVSVYEAMPEPGGMMRYGIPEHRLPRAVLDAEIDNLKRYGIEIHTNTVIGKDITIEELREHGAKAIFIGTGAWKGLKLNIPGEDHHEGVAHVTEFLREVHLGQRKELKGRVLVFGVGHSAMDATRVAFRLGAESVNVIDPFSIEQMPADPEEKREVEEEGAKIHFQVAPKRITIENDKVVGVECVRTRLTEPDTTGRRKFIPIEDSEFFIEADFVISAVGQEPDLDFLVQGREDLQVSKWNLLVVNPETLQTNVPGIFAGGDVITGSATVIEAVEAGKRAARYMAMYMRGEELPTELQEEPMGTNWVEIPADEPVKKRMEVPTLPIEDRLSGFQEVKLQVDEKMAREEAARCLNCGGCCECYQCVEACKARAVTLETHAQEEQKVSIRVGSVILAPGFEPFDPGLYETYKYSAYPNVVTSMEFERILSATGPYQGHLQRPSDQREPKKIAWLQCVGSRDLNRCDHPYCSAVCCMYATKEAVIAREHAEGDLDTAIFFMDMRTYGKDFERYYNRAREEAGVRYIRSRIHSIEEDPESRDLILQYALEDGSIQVETFDMVVLSIGLETPQNVIELAERLDIDLDQDNFALTGSFTPVETSRKGIFVCGAFQEPKDIPQSVMEASAAACEAKERLSAARGTMVKEKRFPEERDVSSEPPRIGVFVCNCGTNIGGILDVPQVADYARTLPGVTYVEDNLFTCSQDTQDKMKEVIEREGLNRVVVAACTPRTHEVLFQETLRDAGLNKYLFEMANIRNQCSWVHSKEQEDATEKAKDLVRMAVARAHLIQPLPQPTIPVENKALVIGGGLSGMTAALGLAEQGYHTYLVEQSDRLGGKAPDLMSTWRGEDIAGPVEEMISQVKAHPSIDVYLEATIKTSEGFVGNFETVLSRKGEDVTLRHGVVIVATGAEESRPAEYLYGEDESVLTHLELDAAIRKEDRKVLEARSVVFIQCVGSREPERPYCSKVCCTHTMKSALKLKEINPDVDICVLYRDLRTYGRREELYREVRAKGVIFVRYDLDDKPKVEKGDGHISVTFRDHVLDRKIMVHADLVVLASGIVPRDNGSLAQMFKLPLNEDGFFMEAHAKLRPVEFATEGIYLAGMAHYPKPIEESVAQAKAAASRASVVLSKKELRVEGAISHVDEILCRGCGECENACPYGAIAVVEQGEGGLKKAQVREALCKGCGACAVACPTGAASIYHYDDQEVLSMVEAALEG